MAESFASALTGRRVVITRAAEQSQPLLAALREKGAQPILLPMVAFAPPDDLESLDAAVRSLREYQWIFFTSQNAVRALQERAEHLKLTLREAVGAAQIAAVGPATAHALRAADLIVHYVAREPSGVTLAQELQDEVRGKHVLLPRSDRANRELVTTLHDFGAFVTEVVAYKTIRPTTSDSHDLQLLLQSVPDAVLFFSPSAVLHFREIIGPRLFDDLSEKSVFAAIGHVTGRKLREAGVQRVIVSRDTTVPSIIESLSSFFADSGHSLPAGAKQP